MPNESETQTTASDNASATASEGAPAPKTGEGTKTYTEEEFNRAKQSASSVAKNEILKELGIATVEQGKSLFSAKSESERKISELEASVKQLTERSARAEEDAEIAKSGVDGKHGEDLRILAKEKTKDGVTTFSQAVSKILEDNPYWKGQPSTAFGPTIKADPKKAPPSANPPEKW